MKTIDTFTFNGSSSTGRGKHDWDSYLNGSIWVVEPQVDFTCKPIAFLTLARTQAKKRGMKLRTGKDGENLVIQAFKDETEEIELPTTDVIAEVASEAKEKPKRTRKTKE